MNGDCKNYKIKAQPVIKQNKLKNIIFNSFGKHSNEI